MGLLKWILLGGWLLLAFVSGSMASEKGRSAVGGFILGLLLGPIGLAVVLLMSPQKSERT